VSVRKQLDKGGPPLISAVSADPDYRQFRFSVGAPEAETKFKQAVNSAQQISHNAMKYPSLYVRVVGTMRTYFILTFARLFTDLASKIGIR
jgi:hypothetical protein